MKEVENIQSSKLRIAIMVKWHSEKMGYATNCLSRALADQGHDVHIFTSKYQVYYNHPNYEEIYGKYLGPKTLPEGVSKEGDITVHRLSSFRIKNKIGLKGLFSSLRKVQPDIVQTFDINEIHTIKASFFSPFFKYKLFTANHFIMISFRLINKWKKLDFKKRWAIRLGFWIPGKIIRLVSKKCYAVTKDSKALAIKFFGFKSSEVEVSVLGVDTKIYYPIKIEQLNERRSIREKIGVNEEEILCIFSGKITSEKSPLVLADSVRILQEMGKPFKAVYVGSGELSNDLKTLPHVTVVDFIPSQELASYYRAADIAVWPRSVTTSIQDAAACGLPVILSDHVFAYMPWNVQNDDSMDRPNIIAAKYETGNAQALAEQLIMLEDPTYRAQIGKHVSDLIEANLSWTAIAKRRFIDYISL